MDPNDLNEFFGRDPVVVDLQAADRWEAIEELIGHLEARRKIKTEDKDAILASVKKRETSMSTGIGFGIAIPHASTDLVSDVVAIIGRSRQGIQFESLDNNPVNLVMLFLSPSDQFQKHLRTLANIAKLMHRHDFRKWLDAL